MNESKNVRKNVSMMLTGMVIGAALTGGSIAVAAGITAEPTWQPIFVDGQQVEMEAYNIAGHNYVKLRDMGKQVSFNVYWDAVNGCVQVESGKPYTGEAPAKAEPDKPESQPEPTAPANDADVDAMKQDIVDRTNALRKENGIAALTTRLGTRTYKVTDVSKVSETDRGGLADSGENMLTLYTCVRNQRDQRWCVTAAEV